MNSMNSECIDDAGIFECIFRFFLVQCGVVEGMVVGDIIM